MRSRSLTARSRRWSTLVGLFVLASCGGKQEGSDATSESVRLPTAATLGEQRVLPAAEYLAAEPYASANRSHGERQAQICKACHSLEEDGPNMIGPALYGFFGRQVGTHGGFEYSAVMRNADFVWTPEAMHAWLAQPGRFLPGNRMVFAGVFDENDRNDLIAYLLQATTDEQKQEE